MACDLEVDIGGLRLTNPVMTASGTFGYGRQFADIMDLNQLGAIVVKGLSLEPSPGNPPPRIVETACGMLNAIGLENVGLEAFIAEKLPFLKTLDVPVIVNIYGRHAEDYARLAKRLDELEKVAGLEVNISCPNVREGGIAFGSDPLMAARVTKAVRKNTGKPVIVKLSPNVTDIADIARSVEGEGADAISLINTLTAMAIDIKTRKPKLANITGGLSGPAIKPVAVRMVWQVAGAVEVPVIGIGGIMTYEDAVEFILAGATAIQVGTASFINPRAAIEVLEGLEAFLIREKISSVKELIGSVMI